MSAYPTPAELIEMQDQLRVMHRKMHDYIAQHPRNERDFVGVAVALTDAVWKLDGVIETAEIVARK